MKKILLFILFPFIAIGQTQIGNDIYGKAPGDRSGYSVSFSSDGTIVAIGSPYSDANGSDSGSVAVYKNVSGIWTQLGTDINGEAAGDNSGMAISLSADGSILAIGAPRNDGNKADSGSVRVYKYISGIWTQTGADIDGKTATDWSGYSVSLSADGSILAVGAVLNSVKGNYSGAVRVYKNISGVWTQIGTDIYGKAAGERNGVSVALSSDGNILAAGAYYSDTNGYDSGSVRVYKNISGVWTQVGVDINGEAAEDNSGWSIALSSDGNTIAIGAPYNDGNVLNSNFGSVRVYKNMSGNWTQIGADIDGEVKYEESGMSLSLSADGNIIAIGAHNNGGGGVNPGLGIVRLYQNISGTWTKIGDEIKGKAAKETSGWNIKLSADAGKIAIGAPYNNKNGTDAGAVRVYNLSGILSLDKFVMSNFSLYPNPASELVTINLQDNLSIDKVNIYNTLGQLIKTEKNNIISVNHLSAGIYYFEIITDKGKVAKAVIIE